MIPHPLTAELTRAHLEDLRADVCRGRAAASIKARRGHLPAALGHRSASLEHPRSGPGAHPWWWPRLRETRTPR